MRRAARALAAALPLALAACSLAPPYRPPAADVPPAFKEAPPGSASAAPDTGAQHPWWTTFADTGLDALEARIERDSPTLAAALARHEQALAAVADVRADLFPNVALDAQASRNRVPGTRPPVATSAVTYDFYTLGGSIGYELDLWGRVRNGVRAARAEAQASDADVAGTRLALQTDLADAYFRLRGLDAQAALLRQTVAAYERAYGLTDTRHSGGIASGLDVSRARAILSGARAQISSVASARAAVEHSIAALVGVPAASFALAPTAAQGSPPPVPAGVPSTLLRRRPDIAASERRVAAANARIGVARAAFFPSLTLGASGGFEATAGPLLTAPASFWALGPIAAALPLFDGGRRAAEVRRARGAFDEAAAEYRATVLTGFREVEDQLAAQRELGAEEDAQRDAAAAAARTEDLALTRYRDGASDYLEVVTAQTAALDAERSAIAVRTQRMQAAVALIRALGGGFGT